MDFMSQYTWGVRKTLVDRLTALYPDEDWTYLLRETKDFSFPQYQLGRAATQAKSPLQGYDTPAFHQSISEPINKFLASDVKYSHLRTFAKGIPGGVALSVLTKSLPMDDQARLKAYLDKYYGG